MRKRFRVSGKIEVILEVADLFSDDEWRETSHYFGIGTVEDSIRHSPWYVGVDRILLSELAGRSNTDMQVTSVDVDFLEIKEYPISLIEAGEMVE